MELAEFITLVSYEVQKAYDFVYESANPEADGGGSVLHISLESVELDVPLAFGPKRVIYEPRKSEGHSAAEKRFAVPYSSERASPRSPLPDKVHEGLAIEVEMISPGDKRSGPGRLKNTGRIKIVVKPILR